MVASTSLDASLEQRHARSGFRVLVVGRAVAVVVESRDFFRAEARGVPPDGVGTLLVPVLGVSDQVSLGHVEALRFALAGLDQRRDRGVDVVVWVLGPSRHVLRLLRPFAFVDRDSESARRNRVSPLYAREGSSRARHGPPYGADQFSAIAYRLIASSASGQRIHGHAEPMPLISRGFRGRRV